MSRLDATARLMLLRLVGLNLRLSVLALPPVLPMIRRDLHLSELEFADLGAPGARDRGAVAATPRQ
jgi:cyanate permease